MSVFTQMTHVWRRTPGGWIGVTHSEWEDATYAVQLAWCLAMFAASVKGEDA